MANQRTEFLEMLVSLGHPVNAGTLSIFDNLEIEAGEDGAIRIGQRITKDMLRESALLLEGTVPGLPTS